MLTRPFRHFGLKVLSLLLAVSLWFMIAGQEQAERSLRVPLEFQNIPERLELIEEPPSLVDVRARGPAGSLGQLRAGDVVAVLDLSTARPGRRLFHLSPEHVSAPSGLRVLHVLPATVTLVFETSATKTVPVVPAVDGDPAPGFVVGRVTAQPATVEVAGPESVLHRLTEATTESVSVKGHKARVRENVNIGVADDAVRLRSARTAVVTVEILRAPVERSVGPVPVRVRNLSRGLTADVTPSAVSVVCKGSAAAVDSLSARTIPAFVDLSGLARGRYNLPVRLVPTSEYGITSVTPEHVRVRIR